MNRVELPSARRPNKPSRRSLIFLSIMLIAANRADIHAQQLTIEAPAPQYPLARPVPAPNEASDVLIAADTQSTQGGHFILDGNVVVTYGNRTVEADHVEYDKATGDLVLTGHVIASGGLNSEHIQASHGTLNTNTNTNTGRFYDVTGSVGIKTPAKPGKRAIYTNDSPFVFTGRMVVKTGPQSYDLYDGTVTSCLLPKPDWLFSASLIALDDEQAKARNSTFRLLNIPIFFFPYVTHTLDSKSRQSGFLIPVASYSNTKGLILGEQLYWVINPSMDLTIGAEYFSQVGWSQMAKFRYRGIGENFVRAHYTGVLDRRTGTLNQGGEDFVLSGRRQFDPGTRAVADIEYLSSFIYREAFSGNFNQAVSTDIVSKAFFDHEQNGYATAFYNDRYQGIKRIAFTDPTTGVVTPAQQIRIFRVPSLELTSVDHAFGHSGFVWDIDATATGLKRSQPNFQTSGIVERYDLHPELAYPLHPGGWDLRPMVAVRETYYSRSHAPGPFLVESTNGLNRADFEAQLDARMPVIERTFTSGWLRNLLRTDFKHTVEPAFTYRYVTGIDNFTSILRFDDHDLAANTNEIQYGVTQRLYLRPRHSNACASDDPQNEGRLEDPLADTLPGGITDGGGDGLQPIRRCGVQEWITWRLTQKHYFDKSFGGAVQLGRRNLFDSTLNLSGIAFLTEPREISPLVSRLRVRASEKIDFEWDFDLDTGAKKFTANNFFVDVHEGKIFSALSYARLNAPGRAYSEGIPSATSDFSQMQALIGFGTPTRQGLAVAAGTGLDLKQASLQYATIQTSYNWNCCGASFEYRRFQLGSVPNENRYRFNFTLVNVGTAGNLTRADRLF